MARALTRGRLREQRGFTLPELLIATVLSMVVIGGAVTLFTASIRSQPRVQSQAAAIQRARTTMERIVGELRQGASMLTSSPSQVSLITYVHDTTCSVSTPLCRVTYTCSGGTCTRTVSRPDGLAPGPAVQVITGLSSNNVFTYTPPTINTPASVAVRLELPAQGGSNAITLSDSATFRNSSAP